MEDLKIEKLENFINILNDGNDSMIDNILFDDDNDINSKDNKIKVNLPINNCRNNDKLKYGKIELKDSNHIDSDKIGNEDSTTELEFNAVEGKFFSSLETYENKFNFGKINHFKYN